MENDSKNKKEAPYINGLHIFSVLGICILFSSPVILIPQNNAIEFPKYWYELLITFTLTYPIHWTFLAMLDNHFLLKIKRLTSPKIGLVLFLTPTLGFLIIYSQRKLSFKNNR